MTELRTPELSTPTRRLLLAAAVAPLLFAVLAVAQSVARDGFDPMRHAVSQLALGSGGWVQTANFLATGLLAVGGAIGFKRALRGQRGETWAPILLGIYGAGFVAAGVFSADPGNGFPPGSGDTSSISGTGLVHLSVAGIAFLALIAACFVLAASFVAHGQPHRAVVGRVCGSVLAVCFIFSNTGADGGTLALFVGAILAWLWVGAGALWFARTPTTS